MGRWEEKKIRRGLSEKFEGEGEEGGMDRDGLSEVRRKRRQGGISNRARVSV